MESNPAMLESLAITPDGQCARHPHVSLLHKAVSPGTAHPPPLRECELCWKEQHDRKNQSCTDLTMATSVSMTPSEFAGFSVPPPAFLQSVTSGTLPAGNGASSEAAKQYAEWSDTVLARWNLVQEIGITSSSRNSSMNDLDESSRTAFSMHLPGLGESWQTSTNPIPHHAYNMSMAAVAEEPEQLMSQPSHSCHTTAAASAETTLNPPWRRLEEQMQRQEECIRQLQEVVQRQETSIRQDLQQLVQVVTTLATVVIPQLQIPENNYKKDISLGILETPIVSNRQIAGQQPPSSETKFQRPSMYRTADHHPASIFTSVRTIERKPPKPPMRHGSFSTKSDSRRPSVGTLGSASHLASIISSLGNSTLNDATTYNDTSATPAEEEAALEAPADSAGYESLLERARRKPLEIIFDASGMINSDYSRGQEDDDIDQQEEIDEEKKSGSSSDSPEGERVSPARSHRQSNSAENLSILKRESFQKSPGSIRLAIPSDNKVERDTEENVVINNMTMPKLPLLRPRSPPSAPARIHRKITPPFQNHSRNNSHRPARQPRRELSVADVSTEKATNRRSGDLYVPPLPPSIPNQHRGGNASNSVQGAAVDRLHPSNLSKLGASTAPPRREIFATANSKLQISSLTIDTSLQTNDYDTNTLVGVKYKEATNLQVTDKFGDKGVYSGTLREEEMEEEGKDGENVAASGVTPGKRMVGIPHGTGTMKYEGGRFYKGTWRDGHWHGNGILRNANGDSYEGEFIYDARHGRGIYKYENGDVYEGDFTEDKRHGKGTFLFHNGSVYRGDFVHGDFDGYGWYEFDDGYYEGEWKGGAYHGIGTLQYTDGGSYTGRFFEGKAHGHGEEKDADGTIRRGVWNKGELSGSSQ